VNLFFAPGSLASEIQARDAPQIIFETVRADYLAQADRLAQLRRSVFSFVVGNSRHTIRTFAEISQITGGKSMLLTNAQDLIDLLVLTVADDIGGGELMEQYLTKYSDQLSEGGRKYARMLLGPGG
jgi:hypothetical protein